MPKLTSLSAEVPTGTRTGYPISPRYAAGPPVPDSELEVPVVPLSHYLWVLRLNLWKMTAFVAVCMLVTFIVSARLKPIYQSTATIDIDMRAPSELVGQGSTPSDFSYDADQILATQMKLIQSDAVLRPVIEQFHLRDLSGQQRNQNPEQAQIAVDAPVGLGGLTVSRPPNTYLLLISYRFSNPRVAADVANAIANSYLKHTYDIRIRSSANLSSFMEHQIDELKAKMERSGLALAQYQKDLDVINPEEKTNILSARLMQLNTNYTTAQAERVSKEAAWDAMKSGSLEAAEISTQGQSLARLNEDLNQARLQLAQVKTIYGIRHPEYQKASSRLTEVEKQFDDTRHRITAQIEMEYRESLNREQMFQSAVAETKAEWDRLNSRSFEYQQLKQDADADKTLYNELIKRIREADINSGFQDNNIRIADVARPPMMPVFPNTRLYVLLSFLLSSLLAIGAALLIDKLDTTIRNPEEASRLLGTNIIGMLPLDRNVPTLPRVAEPDLGDHESPVSTKNGDSRKSSYPSISGFEEAVRTIRNTILLSDF
jgi:succinoglycan biosynthesis transport protein ExoP